MSESVRRVTLVAKLRPGMMTEHEVACIGREGTRCRRMPSGSQLVPRRRTKADKIMAHCQPSQTDADGAALAEQGLEGNEQLETETAQIDAPGNRH